MKKIFHLFFPDRHNSYRPHALRHKWLSVYSIGLLLSHFAFGLAFYTGPINAADSQLTKNIINLTNKSRTEQGIGALSENPLLTQAAYGKLNDMFEKDYWDHKSPDGTEAWSFIEKSGYEYNCAGENLAKGFRDGNSVYNAWMNSPSHRENLLDSKHKDIGIAIGTGKIQGKKTTVIVQLFGSKKAEASSINNASNITSSDNQKMPDLTKPLALGVKTNVPSINIKNATTPAKAPYLALWAFIFSLVVFDFFMIRRLGLHKERYHRFHLRSALILSIIFFIVLLISVASIA